MMHTVIVRNRRVAVVSGGAVADNYGTDVVDLRLDSAFDGCEAVLILGCGDSAVRQVWTGDPLPVPGSLMVEGDIPVSVAGFRDGVRIVTAAGASIRVERAGCYDGSDPAPDDPDMLQQLVQAAGDARSAADTATKAAQTATDAAGAAQDAVAKVGEAVSDLGDAAANAAAARESAEAAAKSATEAKASESSARASAESASSDAGSASSSATAARQRATEAASSATDAKASADLAAGWVPADGEPGQLLAKTDSGTAWVDPPSTGNVLTGEAEGYVAHAEDAYAQKPVEVRVKGRTVKNLWPVINGTSNGVTVSTDKTGLITVSGTATADATITAEAAYAPSSAYVMASTYGSPSTWHIVNGETRVASGMKLAVPSATCGVTVKSGTAVDASFRVMLVEGTEAPDCFTPTASITSVQAGNLVTAGKNLFPTGDDEGWYVGGYDFTRAVIRTNSPMTLPYTSVEESIGVGNAFRVVAGQVYTLTVTGYPKNFSTGLCWALYESLEDTTNQAKAVKWNSAGSAQKTVTTDVLPISGYLVVCVAGQWTDGYSNVGEYPKGMRIQCELGSTATAYEPPVVTETPLPEVELRGLPDGTCDELVIGADGTCEVERRTQLVDGEVVALGTPTTEPQSPITLPALPAPTFNIYHDSQVPSDTSVEYERDVNIAYAELEAKIAALTVAQATS